MIALPLLTLLIAFGGPSVLTFFVSLIALLALVEFSRMGLGDDWVFERWLAAIYGAACIPIVVFGLNNLFVFISLIVFLSLSSSFLFRFKSVESVHYHLGWVLFGLIYLPFLLGHVAMLGHLVQGREWIFLCLISIMGCDSFAYFVGRKFGRRKLYEAVSPNKSVEGALGGLAGSVCAVLICRSIFMPFLGFFEALLIGLLLGVVGQVGDLFESLLKRACGVKDSGAMIPGHGGLLDRLDSLLFAFPLVYYIARYGYGG